MLQCNVSAYYDKKLSEGILKGIIALV